MSEPQIRLYVRSVKTVTGTVQFERLTTRRPRLPPVTVTEPKRDYVLPEYQMKTAEMVKSVASKFGLKVEVVDVARENILRRAMTREGKKIRTFPTLVAGLQRVEGEITEVQVTSLFSRIADASRKKYI